MGVRCIVDLPVTPPPWPPPARLQHVHATIPLLHRCLQAYSPALRRIVRRMLHPDPSIRPNAEDLSRNRILRAPFNDTRKPNASAVQGCRIAQLKLEAAAANPSSDSSEESNSSDASSGSIQSSGSTASASASSAAGATGHSASTTHAGSGSHQTAPRHAKAAKLHHHRQRAVYATATSSTPSTHPSPSSSPVSPTDTPQSVTHSPPGTEPTLFHEARQNGSHDGGTDLNEDPQQNGENGELMRKGGGRRRQRRSGAATARLRAPIGTPQIGAPVHTSDTAVWHVVNARQRRRRGKGQGRSGPQH